MQDMGLHIDSASRKIGSFLISHPKKLLRSEFSLKSYLYLLLRKRKLQDYLIVNNLTAHAFLLTFPR